MNRGTALKWFERIESGRYLFGRGALRSPAGTRPREKECFCIFGVLADFLDPNGWTINALGLYEWHGDMFKLPETWRKRCKMKTVYGNFVSSNGQVENMVDIADGCRDWTYPLYIAKKYYEQF